VFQARKAEAEEHSACAAWVFMIVTAARPSEALGACWAEIDLDRKLWTVPAARMKSAREHIVPLSAAALAVLERQAQVRTGDSVFPGRRGSPISYSTFAVAPRETGIDAATAHGWRSVFRDFCGDVAHVPRDRPGRGRPGPQPRVGRVQAHDGGGEAPAGGLRRLAEWGKRPGDRLPDQQEGAAMSKRHRGGPVRRCSP